MTKEELISRKEQIKKELGIIRLEIQQVDIPSVEYRNLVKKQIAFENELSEIRILWREQNAVDYAIKQIKGTEKSKLLRIRHVVPVYVDDYTGERCDYCGGKINSNICINNSKDWPHESKINQASV